MVIGAAALLLVAIIGTPRTPRERGTAAGDSSSLTPSASATTAEPTPHGPAYATPLPGATAAEASTASSIPTETPAATSIATAAPPGFVSRETMGGDVWPLTVESGVVYCNSIDGGSAILFRTEDAGATVDGSGLFAVNGWAQDHTDLPSIEPIWADNPATGFKKNIKPILDLGLSLCP